MRDFRLFALLGFIMSLAACSSGGDASSIYGNATGGNSGNVEVSPTTTVDIPEL